MIDYFILGNKTVQVSIKNQNQQLLVVVFTFAAIKIKLVKFISLQHLMKKMNLLFT